MPNHFPKGGDNFRRQYLPAVRQECRRYILREFDFVPKGQSFCFNPAFGGIEAKGKSHSAFSAAQR